MAKARRILKTVAFLTFLMPVALNLPGWVAYGIARAKKFDQKAAILVSTDDKKWALDFYFPIVSGQMLYQTLMFRKPVLILGAKKIDLEKMLNDPKVEAVTVIGHGARSFWSDSEGAIVTPEDLKNKDKMFQKREINQYTCGDGRDYCFVSALNGNSASYIPPRREVFFLEHIPDIIKKLSRLIQCRKV